MRPEVRAAVLFLADRLRERGGEHATSKGKLQGSYLLEPDDMRDLAMLPLMRGTTPKRLASRMVADGLAAERAARADEAAEVLWGKRETSDA